MELKGEHLLVLGSLPEELLLHVFLYVGPKDVLLVTSRVCKDWKRLSDEASLWHSFCRDRELRPPHAEHKKGRGEDTKGMHMDWKAVFKACMSQPSVPLRCLRSPHLFVGADLSWMDTSDEAGGFRAPKSYPRVRYAVSKTNMWEPGKHYACPPGFHWATSAEYYRYVQSMTRFVGE